MESVSIADPGDNHSESVMIVDDDSVMPVKTGKGYKKATKAAKDTAAKHRGRAGKTAAEESVQASSFVEPEDDDFQVKVVPMPPKAARGKKRKSEELDEIQDVISSDGIEKTSLEPPGKRRATRSRVSTVQADGVPTSAVHEQASDLHMTDGESILPPPAPVSKKGSKHGRKRGSSTVRKASATSTASMASLRAAVPNDAEIEAALEADLERPLTDEENDTLPQPPPSSKTRRLTRTRPAPKHATASTAPTRRTTRTSTATTELTQDPQTILEAEAKIEQEPESSSHLQPPKGLEVRKVSKKHANTAMIDASQIQESQDPVEEFEADARQLPKSKRTKAQQPSRQVAARNTRASTVPDASTVEYPSLDINSSALASQAAQDDSGHETDASVVHQTIKKRGPKKGAKKPKASKKADMTSRNIEDIVQPEIIPQVPVEGAYTDAMVVDGSEAVDVQIQEATAPALATATKKKSAKTTKTKTSKAISTAERSPSPLPMTEEPWADGILGESTPLPPTVAKTPTPSPTQSVRAHTPIAAREAVEASPKISTPQRPAQSIASPQSSDAENQPPSSRPSALRPPLIMQSPSKAQTQTIRIPLVASTPTTSPSNRHNISKLQTNISWIAVDLEKLFLPSPNANQENMDVVAALNGELTSPQKKLTLEEWIFENARKGEEELRRECERLVGRFEGEGVRALRSLEGIRCVE